MRATPKQLKAIYTMLLEMPPFQRWGLPEPNKVKFVIVNDPQSHGHYVPPEDTEKHEIAINSYSHTTLLDHIMTVAHEMGHMRQAAIGRLPDTHDQVKVHNHSWQRIARVICEALGFPAANF